MPTSHKPVVLLVEDKPSLLIILRRMLDAFIADYDVFSLTTPTEALPHIGTRDVRLVITDYRFRPDTGLDGIQLAAQIKQVSPHTIVVLISGYATQELEERVCTSGIDHYLPKPFQLTELRSLLQRVL